MSTSMESFDELIGSELKSKKMDFSKSKVRATTAAFVKVIVDELRRDGIVRIKDLGTLKVIDRKARKGRNPKNGEEIEIPAKKMVKFSMAKNLDETIN